jgi:hypothetical protein
MDQLFSIDELRPDDKNFNIGTPEGKKLIQKSLQKFGAGRSILLDKNNRIIAGNKTAQGYRDIGGSDVRVIDISPDELVALRRTDMDLDSPDGREMALADNQTSAVDYVPNLPLIATTCQEMAVDAMEWGVPAVEPEEASQVSFSAKKKYSIRIEFPYKGKLKQAEKIINKLIKEQFPEASVTVKMG